MKFADFILRDAIIHEIKASTKMAVIDEMVQSLLNAGGIKKGDKDTVIKSIVKREELGSTGIGRGIAVPHTKHPSVERLVGCVGVSADGIDFDSLDCEKVHLFFLLVSPPDRPSEHLRALEYITRQLKDDAFCRFLKQVKNQADIVTLLEEADNNLFGGK
ncbi:MAG: PTS sugar transporter subunit IIA [Thermoguttaceae bacterium]